jgi:hypothetical protein
MSCYLASEFNWRAHLFHSYMSHWLSESSARPGILTLPTSLMQRASVTMSLLVLPTTTQCLSSKLGTS